MILKNPKKFANELSAWYQQHKRDLPFRTTHEPYHIFLSEMMAQQTQMDTLIPYFNRFIKTFPTIEALANAPTQQVLKAWEGLGYYRRAKYVHESAQAIMNHHDGNFPTDLQALLALKGVGDYTAAAIHSIAFNKPSIAIDGNVARVTARLFAMHDDILKTTTKKKMKTYLEPLMKASEPRIFTQAMMELGALVCQKEPRCASCPLKTHCTAYQTNQQHRLPNRSSLKAKQEETYFVFVIRIGDQVVLRQRPSEGLLANMYEFIQYRSTNLNDGLIQLANDIEGPIKDLKSLGTIKHVFTHKIWHLKVILVDATSTPHKTYHLKTFPYAMSKAHRKIIDLMHE